MGNFIEHGNEIFFIALPYVSLVLFFVVTIQRYRSKTFTYSSLSSQLLENQYHFISMVPFHYGIISVLTGHLIAFAIPKQILLWNGNPLRLYILETAALICGLLTLYGIIALFIRRVSHSKLRTVSTLTDWIVISLIFIQVVTGIIIAVFHPWGSSWFATSASPYLWSIITFSPDISYIAAMPIMVKLHIINACLIIGFFPFTRLVHVLVVPNPYLWRKPQVVRWNWIPKAGTRKHL